MGINNAKSPSIAKRLRTMKKILYFIVLQIPVPKGKTVTGNFYKNVFKKNLKKNNESYLSKTV